MSEHRDATQVAQDSVCRGITQMALLAPVVWVDLFTRRVFTHEGHN